MNCKYHKINYIDQVYRIENIFFCIREKAIIFVLVYTSKVVSS